MVFRRNQDNKKNSANHDIAISLQNITKDFYFEKDGVTTLKERFIQPFKKIEVNQFRALEDISFDIHKKEFFGIIGRNGSGKSTLLKLIAGIYAANKGDLVVNGKIIPFLELGVGFNPELTASENLYLNGTILGMKRKDLEELHDDIFEWAEIPNFKNMQLKHFSSGMMVRLAFAIAIKTEGDIYIMDEVLAVGDSSFQQKCLTKLNELIAAGKTIVFVSHSEGMIKQYCSRVAYIKDHKLAFLGTPDEAFEMYNKDLSEPNN